MMELREFIEARLAEDEERFTALRDAGLPESIWCGDPGDEPRIAVELNGPKRYRRVWLNTAHLDWGWVVHDEMAEVFRYADIGRGLREVAAKRAILKAHEPFEVQGDPFPGCRVCSWRDDVEELHDGYPCLTLRLLASIFADHPDYRAEWSVT